MCRTFSITSSTIIKKDVSNKTASSLHAEENISPPDQHPSRNIPSGDGAKPDETKSQGNPYRQLYRKRESDDEQSQEQPPKKKTKRAKNTDWREMYDRLVAYKAKFQTTRVPQGYKADPALGRWVHGQRYHCKESTKVDLLNQIGFAWKPLKLVQEREWMDVYKRLVAYKARFGTADVPQRYKEDPALGRWVHRQRYDCKAQDRIDLLNAVGYDWLPPKERKWMDMYERLVAYHQKFRTTRIERRQDKELFCWVKSQRNFCKNERRASLLNKIGFDWPELTI